MTRNEQMTTPMKSVKAIATALLIAIGFNAFAADGGVEIKGNVIANGADLGDAMVIVELDNAECMYVPLNGNGKFTVRIPEGRNAKLRFDKLGYTAKEVVLNTDHADEIRKYNKERAVKFDVRLTPQPKRYVHEYKAPVGHITFAKGGLMKVKYDYRLRPVEYNDLSVGE